MIVSPHRFDVVRAAGVAGIQSVDYDTLHEIRHTGSQGKVDGVWTSKTDHSFPVEDRTLNHVGADRQSLIQTALEVCSKNSAEIERLVAGMVAATDRAIHHRIPDPMLKPPRLSDTERIAQGLCKPVQLKDARKYRDGRNSA